MLFITLSTSKRCIIVYLDKSIFFSQNIDDTYKVRNRFIKGRKGNVLCTNAVYFHLYV